MFKNTIDVKDSFFSSYFDSVEKNTIFMSDKEYAKKKWEFEFGIGTKSYFDLPDNHWVVSSKEKIIFRWLEAYNDNEYSVFSKKLLEMVSFEQDEVVNFYCKKNLVFYTRWGYFLDYWFDFITIEDDCPMLIIEHKCFKKQCLLFTPVGNVLLITQ